MKGKPWIPIFVLLPLLLGGCAGTVAKLATFGDDLTDAATSYVSQDVIGKRVEVRGKCWELVMEEVQELRQEGKRDEARALLAGVYPPLTILQALDEGDASVVISELNQARPCEVQSE